MNTAKMWLLVHILLGLAIVGYTYQNSEQLKHQDSLGSAVRFVLQPKIVILVLACNLMFVVTYWMGIHRWGLNFWTIQLAFWATGYIGLILFWRWNNFVPTRYEWMGVALSLLGSLVAVVGPQIRR